MKTQCPEGKSLLQPVDYLFYAVLNQWYIPVQKEAEIKIGQFKISQELGFVYRSYFINGLVFDNYSIINNHVSPKTGVDFDSESHITRMKFRYLYTCGEFILLLFPKSFA